MSRKSKPSKGAKAYKYSKYQYRVDIVLPDGRKHWVRSFVHRSSAETLALRLGFVSTIRAIVTRRCDGRVLYDSWQPYQCKRYAPLLMSEAA